MIGLGLLWDVVDAAAYFCAQRRERLRVTRIPAWTRCVEVGPSGLRCDLPIGHIEQHHAIELFPIKQRDWGWPT